MTSQRSVPQVRSYARRGSRLSPRRQRAWEAHQEHWWVPDDAAQDTDFDIAATFDRPGPLVVEVGSGVGEAAVALATAHPEWNLLAFEVWRPGVAATFVRMEEAGVGNIRVCSLDAAWAVEHLLGPESVDQMLTFFPDPWPKRRHRRRRLLTPHFAAVVAARLRPGGLWRLATDHASYAALIEEVAGGEPRLSNLHDRGPAPRWEERPMTRFERRGIQAGHQVRDFCYRRVGTLTPPGQEPI